MKFISTFYLVVLFSCLGHAESEEVNPYQPPPGTPTLLSLRDFEHEYDLKMERHIPGGLSIIPMALLGGVGYTYGAAGLDAMKYALSRQDYALPSASFMAFMGSLVLVHHLTFLHGWSADDSAVQKSLLDEQRYAHLRDSVDTSKPMPCRATFAKLANPFRLSRVRSRLVPLAIGAGAAVASDEWLYQDQSALSGLKSLFFKK